MLSGMERHRGEIPDACWGMDPLCARAHRLEEVHAQKRTTTMFPWVETAPSS